jgi:hypothetical protein
MDGKVAGRGVHTHPLVAQQTRRKLGAVGQRAAANGQVQPFIDQVGRAVAEVRLDHQARMLGRQRQQHRPDAAPSEQFRAGQAQPTPHLIAPGLHRGFRRLQLVQRPPAALVIALALVRQRLRARGAVKQPCAQPRFKPRHPFANGRSCEVQPGGGPGKAAGLDGCDKDVQALEAVAHGRLLSALLRLIGDF